MEKIGIYGHPRKWTPEEDDYLRSHYGKGTSFEDMKRHLGCAIATLHRRAKRLGLTAKRKEFIPEELKEKIRSLHHAMPNKEIARRLGINIGKVTYVMHHSDKSPKRRIYTDDKGRQITFLNRSTGFYWSPQMLADLRRLYPRTTNSELAGYFGISSTSVYRKARELGIVKDPQFLSDMKEQHQKMMHLRNKVTRNDGMIRKGQHKSPATEFKSTWSQDDLEYLRVNYGKIPNSELAEILNRPVACMVSKASKLGLTNSNYRIKAEQCDIIRKYYRTTTAKQLSAMTGLSVSQIRSYAYRNRITRDRRLNVKSVKVAKKRGKQQ